MLGTEPPGKYESQKGLKPGARKDAIISERLNFFAHASGSMGTAPRDCRNCRIPGLASTGFCYGRYDPRRRWLFNSISYPPVNRRSSLET